MGRWVQLRAQWWRIVLVGGLLFFAGAYLLKGEWVWSGITLWLAVVSVMVLWDAADRERSGCATLDSLPCVEDLLAAEERAKQVLRIALTDRQWNDYCQRGGIEIKSPSDPDRVYWVPRWVGTVKVFQSSRLVAYLCVQPVKFLPPADVALMHKLWIEGDEDGYLATANRWTTWAGRQEGWSDGPQHGSRTRA